VLERAKQPHYQFEPYYKVSDGLPGWQWEFLLAAKDYKGRVALGANRIGKSEMGAYEMALYVTGQHPVRKSPKNGLAWIVGLDNPMIRDIDRPLFEKFMPQHWLKEPHGKYVKQDNIWYFNCEGRQWKVVFKSTEMGSSKFQGSKVDAIWVDEEPRQGEELWQEIEARLVDMKGIFWITATPVRGTAWLKGISERDGVHKTFAGMRDNPYLPADEVNEFAKTLSEDDRAVRIDGKYLVFGGKPVFNRRKLEAHAEKYVKDPVEKGMLI
jgi:phage terminase large subunit-like protein